MRDCYAAFDGVADCDRLPTDLQHGDKVIRYEAAAVCVSFPQRTRS